MKIRDLFDKEVTRAIPPVIYFHEQSPEQLRDEVTEYIITGGYNDGHPAKKRVPVGIHEQFVRLLTGIERELDRRDGPSEPACWISGFYGSGKSSFAKLLGLALDGRTLPDGVPLCDALLRQDKSPNQADFKRAWDALITKVEPMAVVFDVGGVARDNEHIHSTVLRQTQQRLGYCKHPLVADFELRLERDGLWADFEAAAQRTLGRPWQEAVGDSFADDHFSTVMHALQPDRFPDAMSWIDVRAGADTRGLAPTEATRAIADMLEFRAPGKHLFVVVDEVSQYIHQDEGRMLKLQSFVSSLKEQLRGRVWLLVTGQEKLEEEAGSTVLAKMQDRFPVSLRVHLASTNIRDVVHRRLLAKKSAHEPALRALFEQHRSKLSLYAYGGDELTPESFVETYPLLPGFIDLLLQITTAMRARSTRTQSDDHAIRGLLQLLGELFRTQGLADDEVGRLISIDTICDAHHTALDTDTRKSLDRALAHCAKRDDADGARAAKAVALLQLVAESAPVSAERVARCLYARLDAGDERRAIADALERLRAENLLGYSEKRGYKLQSSAAQEWERERTGISVTPERQYELIREKLKLLVGIPTRPELKGVPIPLAARFSDGRQADDVRLVDPRTDTACVFDFRLALPDAAAQTDWSTLSGQGELATRVLWLVGAPEEMISAARELGRSRMMVQRYEHRVDSLERERRNLLNDERSRADTLEETLRDRVEAAWLDGTMYFQGAPTPAREHHAGSFGNALLKAASDALPGIYPSFEPIVVTDGELATLLERDLRGESPKFLETGLGILTLDAGRIEATCSGRVPSAVAAYVKQQNGTAGESLFKHFGKPPYGYGSTLVRACLAGLLRGMKVRIRPKSGPEVTSMIDPGAKDLFRRERDLRQADIFPGKEGPVTGRDRVAIAAFFQRAFGVALPRENDALADAAYQHLPGAAARLRALEGRLARLPGAPDTPEVLVALHKALEDCRRSRQVEPTVIDLKRHLTALTDGMERLAIDDAELTDAAVAAVQAIDVAVHRKAAPLAKVEAPEGALAAAIERLEAQLATAAPWRGAIALAPDVDLVDAAYRDVRGRVLAGHERAIEAGFAKLCERPGVREITDAQLAELERLVGGARISTDDGAVAPALDALDALFAPRLVERLADAHRRLDEMLKRVRVVNVGLSNVVVESESDLDRRLAALRERVKSQLDAGYSVRLE